MDIVDKEGCFTKKEMRERFEEFVKTTSALSGNTPLGSLNMNGEFVYYMNKDTDTLWLGFALGMRVAQKLLR